MTVLDIPQGMTREAVEHLSAAKNEPDWMRDFRLRAWQIFESLPMPTLRDEEWRRTDIRRLILENLSPYGAAGGASVPSPLRLEGNVAGTIIHQNSDTIERTVSEDLARQGVIFTDLDTALREHPDLVRRSFMTQAVTPDYNKFTALNAAFWSGGTFLYVPRQVEIALPLRALYTLTAGGAGLFTHTLIVVEPGARLTYIEEYAAAPLTSQALNAGVVEIILSQNAHFTFIGVQDWPSGMYDISTARAVMERDSRLDWLAVGTGAGITKANIEAGMTGPGATTQMLGMVWGHGASHTDLHTVQDHIAPHTTSDLLYKNALTDSSRSVFSGRIRVEKGAQGTDAYQANRNILLSEKASSFPSPNLEIEANEVRCTHGASVGKVDEDQLFYLMARGLPRAAATRMIVEGFFEEVLQREPADSIRDNLRDLMVRKLDES